MKNGLLFELKKSKQEIDSLTYKLKRVTSKYEQLDIDYDSDIVIEPSAGNCSFLDIIKRLCKNYKLYDIDASDILGSFNCCTYDNLKRYIKCNIWVTYV